MILYIQITAIISLIALIVDGRRNLFYPSFSDILFCIVIVCVPPMILGCIWYIVDSSIYFYKIRNKV